MYGRGEVRQFINLLAEHRLGWTSVQLHAEPERKLPDGMERTLLDDLAALEHYRPIQYIIGMADFFGRRFEVNEEVLIPRPETEELAGLAIEMIRNREDPFQRILDIGTGSGCIGITIKLECPETVVTAIDKSVPALQVARRNADRYRCGITMLETDLFSDRQVSALGKFTLIVSNPPYVLPEEANLMNPNVLEHEPRGAIFVEDPDPLLFYRRIAVVAPRLAAPQAVLLTEINERYGREIEDLYVASGFHEVTVIRDALGKDRFVTAQVPGSV